MSSLREHGHGSEGVYVRASGQRAPSIGPNPEASMITREAQEEKRRREILEERGGRTFSGLGSQGLVCGCPPTSGCGRSLRPGKQDPTEHGP